jgi:hypothetical protein
MTKYRIYIDEVGNPDLGSSDDPNHRFLSLTGVILELGHVERVVHPQMEALKAKFFRSHPDDPVIFHRKEMLNARPPFAALKDGELRRQFDEELLGLLATWPYTVITVCLDKKHKEAYATHPERFVRQPPRPLPLPREVWINPPADGPEPRILQLPRDTNFVPQLSQTH